MDFTQIVPGANQNGSGSQIDQYGMNAANFHISITKCSILVFYASAEFNYFCVSKFTVRLCFSVRSIFAFFFFFFLPTLSRSYRRTDMHEIWHEHVLLCLVWNSFQNLEKVKNRVTASKKHRKIGQSGTSTVTFSLAVTKRLKLKKK